MIDTEALRNKLLQQAVRGQLSERMSTDTPVDSTLKPYTPTRDVVLPEIPPEWRYCKFDHVFINRDSERIPVSVAERKKRDKIYDYYGASGVIDKIDDYLFDEKLLLIGEDGANLLSRSTPIAFIADGKYWVNNHAHVLQMSDFILLEFAEIAINAMPLEPYVTGSAQPKLSQRMMNTIAVPIPPIEEQARIVQKLAEAFRILGTIDSLQKSFASNTSVLKERIASSAIHGQLTEQLESDGTTRDLLERIGAKRKELQKAKVIKKTKPFPPINRSETPFEIPENWEWVHLGDLYALSNGTASRGSAGGSPRPVLRLADLTGDSINVGDVREIALTDKEYATHTVDKDDLIIIRVNGSKSKVASFFVFPDAQSMSYCDHLFCAKSFSGMVDPAYIALVCRTDLVRMQVDPLIKTTAGQNTISQGNLGKTIIPLPPLAEQKRIVERVNYLLQALPDSEN